MVHYNQYPISHRLLDMRSYMQNKMWFLRTPPQFTPKFGQIALQIFGRRCQNLQVGDGLPY